MRIRVNGETRDVRAGTTVADLLDELDLDRRAVVVELNREILRGEELGETGLEPEDRLELVQFVGGG